jgi:hypothetical protein
MHFMIRAVHLLVVVACASMQSCTATRFAHQINQKYSPAAPVEVERTAVFPRGTFDRVWESVISFFATQQISIETVEKESGIIVARRMLMASTDGAGMAALGMIETERALLKQTMEPTQFAGSANSSIVRATGRIAKQEVVASSVVRTSQGASYQVAVSFNVFVSRFSETELRVTINTSMTPGEPLRLWCGWYWVPELSTDTPGGEAVMAAGLASQGMPPTVVEARPVSNGSLEESLLAYLKQQVK